MPTQASLDTAQGLYLAYTGCSADAAGLVFWAGQLDSTDDLSVPISVFGAFGGFLAEYGELDNEALINSLYQRLFNRDADPEGLAFYVGRLESGDATLASIPKQIYDGALGNDVEILWNNIYAAQDIADFYFDFDTVTEDWDVFLDTVGFAPVIICEEISYVYEQPLVIVAGVSEGEANSLFDI